VAIVGARRASEAGRHIARALAEGLADLGITVVSGLARGIDAQAHRGALAAGGRTLAVLGNGIDVVYPAEHRTLASRITEHGALLSELAPGSRPARHHFPVRNRVIAALAHAVVVVEAADRSGSLITARHAADEGRAVLALPGSPLSASHRGSNRLLQDGARLVLGLEDVLAELPREVRERRPEPSPETAPARTETERRVLDALSVERPLSVDDVAGSCDLAAREVSVVLVQLELGRDAARVAGGLWLRTGPLPRPSTE